MEPSDRERFVRALGVLAYSTNGDRKLPDHIADAYWKSLKPHPLPRVLDVLTGALKNKGDMPAVGELLAELKANDPRAGEARAAELRAQREADDQEADRIGLRRFGFELWRAPNFQAMKREANAAYSKRVCGMAPEPKAFTGGAYHQYTGGFDYMPCVQAAPLPKTSHLDEHQQCWETFWKLLREEYQLWIEANRERIADGIDVVKEAAKPPYFE